MLTMSCLAFRKTQSLIYLAVSSDYLVNIAFVRRIIRYDSKLYDKMYTGMIEFSVYWDGRYGWKGNEVRLLVLSFVNAYRWIYYN